MRFWNKKVYILRGGLPKTTHRKDFDLLVFTLTFLIKCFNWFREMGDMETVLDNCHWYCRAQTLSAIVYWTIKRPHQWYSRIQNSRPIKIVLIVLIGQLWRTILLRSVFFEHSTKNKLSIIHLTHKEGKAKLQDGEYSINKHKFTTVWT